MVPLFLFLFLNSGYSPPATPPQELIFTFFYLDNDIKLRKEFSPINLLILTHSEFKKILFKKHTNQYVTYFNFEYIFPHTT